MIRTIAAALAAFVLVSFGVRAEDAKPAAAEQPKADAKAEKAEKKAEKKEHHKKAEAPKAEEKK